MDAQLKGVLKEVLSLHHAEQRRRMQRTLGMYAAAAVVLAGAEVYNGSLTKGYKYFKRTLQQSIAQWLEDQGGLPLYTVEGDEPKQETAEWSLPGMPASLSASLNAGAQAQQAHSSAGSSPVQAHRTTSVSSDGSSNEVPNFFNSTKFFSCLDLKESQELFETTQMVRVGPHEVLFSVGDSSAPGIFIVVEGALGVYLQDGDQRLQTNVLRTGETVGDLDVLDGATRSMTCIAMEEGALLTQVSRDLFVSFIASKPRTLQIYLHKAIARLWRVAHFMLSDFLNLPLDAASLGHQQQRHSISPAASLVSPHVFVTAPPIAPRARPSPHTPPHPSAESSPGGSPLYRPPSATGKPPSSKLGRVGSGVMQNPVWDSYSAGPRGRPVQQGRKRHMGYEPGLSVVSEADSSGTEGSTPAASSPLHTPDHLDSGVLRGGRSGQLERLYNQPAGSADHSGSNTPPTQPDSSLTAGQDLGAAAKAMEPLAEKQEEAEGDEGGAGDAEEDADEGSHQELETQPPQQQQPKPKQPAGAAQMWSPFGAMEAQYRDSPRGSDHPSTPASDATAGRRSLDLHSTASEGSEGTAEESDEEPGFMHSLANLARLSLDRQEADLEVGDGTTGEEGSEDLGPLPPAPAGPAVRARGRSGSGSRASQASDKASEKSSGGMAGLLSSAAAAFGLAPTEEQSAPSAFKDAAAADAERRDRPGETSGRGTDDAIASSIRSDMERKRQMSLPVAMMLRAPSAFHPILPTFQEEQASPAAKPQDSLHRMCSLLSPIAGVQASSLAGWDVVSPEECLLSNSTWRLLTAAGPPGKKLGARFVIQTGQVLQQRDKPCRQFFVLLEGRCVVERPKHNGTGTESASISQGSLVGCAAYLSSTRAWATVTAAQTCKVAAFGNQELEMVQRLRSDAFIELLLASARSLCPLIRRFLSMGLNRVWLKAGHTAYQQGEGATSLFVVISGRVRLVREDPSARPSVRVEEEVGRGDSLGAVWALTGGVHDTSALAIRDSELVRMSKARRPVSGHLAAFEQVVVRFPQATAKLMEGMTRRLAAASTVRQLPPTFDPFGHAASSATAAVRGTPLGTAAAPGGQGVQRGEIVTIALVPAGLHGDEPRSLRRLSSTMGRPPGGPPSAAAAAVKKLGAALKESLEKLFGTTLHLSASTVELTFPSAYERLHSTFFRTKVTSWMAAQEEDYRFILMEADTTPTPWSKICISHADCILLVGAGTASPEMNSTEQQLVWDPMGEDISPRQNPLTLSGELSSLTTGATLGALANSLGGSLGGNQGTQPAPQGSSGGSQHGSQRLKDAKQWVAQMRRVELVMLHEEGAEPSNTAPWLEARPNLARHHHIRITHSKDMARLSRWMAGKAVGLVLSGGGSRGLAHLGVLHALDDAGIPVDVIGGTSQGAFMAALYAQGLSWDSMHATVQTYSKQMGSIRHLLSDLTLPLVSVFSGHGFDRVVRETFAEGASRIEDLWLSFFCMSTNLSRGEPSVHTRGLLWRLVRASMTIVGLVPPVYEQGELLVDGGYLNNIPVDVMRGLGVATVIVVDVEDRDASVWADITSYDGGLSGWRLLWDRWCPIPSLRYNYKLPRYNQMMNALTWMSHAQNLKRVAREHVIDLYLRPPVTRFRLMDYHFMDRIVRDANRYAWAAISQWQVAQGVTQQGLMGSRAPEQAASTNLRRTQSTHCMTQLQAKQAPSPAALQTASSSAASPRSSSDGPRRGVAEQRKSADDALGAQPVHKTRPKAPAATAPARPRAPSNLSQSKASPSGTHREPLGEQEPAAGDTPAHGRAPRGTPREEPAGDQRHEQGSQHELQLTSEASLSLADLPPGSSISGPGPPSGHSLTAKRHLGSDHDLRQPSANGSKASRHSDGPGDEASSSEGSSAPVPIPRQQHGRHVSGDSPGGLAEEAFSFGPGLASMPDELGNPSIPPACAPEIRKPSLDLSGALGQLVGDVGGRRGLASHPSHATPQAAHALPPGLDPDDLLLDVSLDDLQAVLSPRSTELLHKRGRRPRKGLFPRASTHEGALSELAD